MKELTMPHHNLYPEIIFAGAIWLMAILIFVFMLIATFASLRSKDNTGIKSRPETKFKFGSVVAGFTKFIPKRKIEKNEQRLDIS